TFCVEQMGLLFPLGLLFAEKNINYLKSKKSKGRQLHILLVWLLNKTCSIRRFVDVSA
ncbi:hypothetical protein ACJX0J_006722, partial [Zea mays]